MNKYTQAELLALDPKPCDGEIGFYIFPGNTTQWLWLEFEGIRYYNLAYSGNGEDVRIYARGPCNGASI